MLHQQNNPNLKLNILRSAPKFLLWGKQGPSWDKHLGITLKTWELLNNTAILCKTAHLWMHWGPAKNEANSRPCLLKNEVIWPLGDMLKYWIRWDGGMTCGTTAFHKDAQPSSKSRLNWAPSTSLPREASYEMTWQHTCTARLKYHSSFFLSFQKNPKKTQKVIVAPGWTETHCSKLHMQDQNHNKHCMANKASFMVSS